MSEATRKPARSEADPVSGLRLQRKCACGQHTAGGGECEDCRKKRQGTLQRSALGRVEGEAPPIVHEVLRSSGRPLDPRVRGLLEPGFRRDFSQVRVHDDSQAADSARAVGARAYTVGRDIAFGAGRYAPATREGQRLLAHELTHVVQQGERQIQASLEIGPVADSLEAQAERTAEAVLSGRPAPHLAGAGGFALQRQPDLIPVDLVPASPEESKRLKEMGIHLPTVSDETWRDIGGIADNAGKKLSNKERTQIPQITKAPAPAGPIAALVNGPQFVLHDTASKPTGKDTAEQEKKEASWLDNARREARGPLGSGVAAWVPEKGDAVVSRPTFFDARRPTATEFEKRADLIGQAGREAAFQKIWKAASPTVQTAALQTALAGLDLTPQQNETQKQLTSRALQERKLTPAEVTAEQAGAKKQLDTPLPAPKKGAKPHIMTTASWAIGAICDQLKTAPPASLAVPGQEKALEDGCATLSQYLAEREPRLGSMVNVEIVKEAGSACRTDEKKGPLKVLSPYSASQYQNLVLLYLRTTLQTDRFPEITTHFWVDRTAGDHCDPRCFNLMHLYDLIAASLGHGIGSTYGVKPNYGITQGTHNLWWADKVCGGPHP